MNKTTSRGSFDIQGLVYSAQHECEKAATIHPNPSRKRNLVKLVKT